MFKKCLGLRFLYLSSLLANFILKKQENIFTNKNVKTFKILPIDTVLKTSVRGILS